MTDKEFEIEILDSQTDQDVGIQLPLNFLSFGEIENDDVKVYIKQSTYKALEKLALSDTSKELGSILIGDYSLELGKTHLVISDYIEAKYTDASASTLTFTHETWDYIHKEHELRYPQKKIIGWQHTHPNYGIFLSNYDTFIQENFFNMPFQVAYVIDPIQNIRGFFQWKNGKIEKLKGYYIYDDIGKPIKIEQTRKKSEENLSSPKKSRISTFIIALLCIATALLSLSLFMLRHEYKEQLKNQEEIFDLLNDQSSVISSQADTIHQLQGQIDDNQVSLEELREKLENNSLPEQQDFVKYTVIDGDSLSTICSAHGINYYAMRDEIMEINNITDGNMIYTGQILLLPPLA